MKIDDLYEYNKGIQDPTQRKAVNQNDDEMEMEPLNTKTQEKKKKKRPPKNDENGRCRY